MRRGRIGWIAGLLMVGACGGASGGSDSGVGGTSTSGGSSNALGGLGTGGLGPVGGHGQVGGAFATGGGAASGGGAMTGGGPGAARTEYEACAEYVAAICNRRDVQCGGLDTDFLDPCPESTELCPDNFFSEGSSWTVESLLACAEEWRTASCDHLNAHRVPECARPPGQLTLGEPCRFSSQCESYACDLVSSDPEHPDCGQCVPVVAEGASCEYGVASCDDGFECTSDPDVEDARTCQPIPVFNRPPGAACERYGQCQLRLGYYCIDNICQERPGIGDPCPTFDCASGAYCAPDSSTCQPYPEAGEPCLETETGLFCRAGLQCDGAPPGGPTCAEGLPAGQDCTRARNGEVGALGCASGLSCLCDDDGGDDDECLSAHCIQKRRLGETCDDTVLLCNPGTVCESGVCKGQETQGLFSQACGE